MMGRLFVKIIARFLSRGLSRHIPLGESRSCLGVEVACQGVSRAQADRLGY